MEKIEIAGKFFTPEEAREIDAEIDKLDALMRQRRARVLAAMDAEQCSCSSCDLARQFLGRLSPGNPAQLFADCTCDGSTICAPCNVMIIAGRGAG